jgi:hypothetical protein
MKWVRSKSAQGYEALDLIDDNNQWAGSVMTSIASKKHYVTWRGQDLREMFAPFDDIEDAQRFTITMFRLESANARPKLD